LALWVSGILSRAHWLNFIIVVGGSAEEVKIDAKLSAGTGDRWIRTPQSGFKGESVFCSICFRIFGDFRLGLAADGFFQPQASSLMEC